MLNFWESDDFSLINMTEAINVLPVVPSKIGAMNLFKGEGVATTFVGVESQGSTLHLIPTQPRGTMPEYKGRTTRNLRAIQVPHIPKNSTLLADDVQNIREFGTEDGLVSPAKIVNSRLEELKQEHELTKEFHRLGALQGKVYDADGTSLVYDLFDIFGVTRTTINWDTTSGTAGLLAFATSVKRAMSDAMQGLAYTDIHVFVGETFWDTLTQHDATIAAFEAQAENAYAREGGAPYASQFNYLGLIWEEYRGAIGGTPFVPDAEGFAFPITSAGIYKERWAPAPFNETVNTLGKPFYAKQEELRFGIGTEIHTQCNPLYIVTKPKALIRLTFSE